MQPFFGFKKFLSHGKFNSRVVTSFIFTITLKVFSLGLPVIYKSTPNVPFPGLNNLAPHRGGHKMVPSSNFSAWVLDEVSQIHQVKHVAEIEFLFTFQFIIKYFQSTQDLITQIIIFPIFNLKYIKNDPSTKISISAALPFSSIVLILIWFAPQGVPHSDLVIFFHSY